MCSVAYMLSGLVGRGVLYSLDKQRVNSAIFQTCYTTFSPLELMCYNYNPTSVCATAPSVILRLLYEWYVHV